MPGMNAAWVCSTKGRERQTQRYKTDMGRDTVAWGVCYTYTVHKQAKTLEEDVRCRTLFLSILLP